MVKYCFIFLYTSDPVYKKASRVYRVGNYVMCYSLAKCLTINVWI